MCIRNIIGLILMLLGAMSIGYFLEVNNVSLTSINVVWFVGSLVILLVGFFLLHYPKSKAKELKDFVVYEDGGHKTGKGTIPAKKLNKNGMKVLAEVGIGKLPNGKVTFMRMK